MTDINALHDAYGAYVQFSAFRSLFVINPSIIFGVNFMSTFVANEGESSFSLFLVLCERKKNHRQKKLTRKKKAIVIS